MKANLHDQFLEGWAGVIPPGYSATGSTVASSNINLYLLRYLYASNRQANLNVAATIYKNCAALLHDMNRAAEAAKLEARAAEIRAKSASKKQKGNWPGGG